MIPVRVHLNGFMSYREAAEFQFEGSALWMLAGPNGAGKSTVFDAITFALFGETRAGSTNYKELINHQSENLVAEVDFRIGEDIYRVKRTLNKRNRSTFQAWHLEGPNPPPGKGVPGEARAIPDAESRTGLESWVRDVLGLDRDTFSTSVLLRQGKSDALLNAEPRERHRMLAQIVGLKAYDNLHKRVVELGGEAKTAAAIHSKTLETIAPVDEDYLNGLSRVMEAADKAKSVAQAERDNWTSLLVHCRAWHELRGEQTGVETQLQTARELIRQSPQIRTDAARLKELQDALPRLRELRQVRQHLSDCEHEIERLTSEEKTARNSEAQAQKTLEAARARQNELLAQQSDWQMRRATSGDRLTALAEPLAKLNQLAELRRELTELNQRLAEFPDDLEAQLKTLQNVAAETQDIKNARPWLEQFAQACEEYKKARADGLRAKEDKTHWLARVEALEPQSASLSDQETAAINEANEAREALGQARARGVQIKDSEARLQSVAHEPACSYCGQPLSEEHLEEERERLRAEKANAQRDYETAMAKQKAAQSEVERLQRERKAVNDELCNVKIFLQDSERAFARAKETSQNGATRGTTALDQLPESWRVRIAPAGEAFENCYKSAFPSAEDLAEMRRRERESTTLAQELSALQQHNTERQKIVARQEPVARQVAALEVQFPPATEAQLRAEYQAAQDDKTQADMRLHELTRELESAGRELQRAQNTFETAQQARRNAVAALAEQNEQRGAFQGATSAIETSLSAGWREAVRELSPEHVRDWENEASSLKDAPARMQELEKAEHAEQSLQVRLTELENKLDDVPRDARRAPEEIEEAQRKAKFALDEAEAQWRDAHSEKSKLVSDKQQRAQAEADFHRETHRAQLLKILGEYLGPDKLQRYLLQEAENAIVAHSNQVLDRISNGTLRIELRANAATSSSKEPTALDMVAFNSETSEHPLPVALLSGSQRFRVAVALALGMGQFASQGTHRIESVIIDEGFGSLDQDGRREMIDELHSLKNVLQRIILVSHQEEFSDAFPNRYAIELHEGASRVTLVDER